MRIELPQSAINGIACAAGRKQSLQRAPIRARFDVASCRFYRRGHGLRGIAEIVNARSFATAALPAVREGGDDHILLFEYKTRNSKRCRQAQFLDLNAQ